MSMSQSKPTFEDYIDLIENKMGLKLMYWQKEMLRRLANEERVYISQRYGKTVFMEAAKILQELKDKGELK